MDVPSLFLILAVALLVGVFISRPFANRRSATEKLIHPAADENEIRRSSLLAERDRVLMALQDLEFDYTLGKIPAETYPVQRTELLTKGAAVLRQLDELMGTKATTSAESRLEAVVAARRADAMVQPAHQAEAVSAGFPAPAGVRRPPASGEDDIEALVAARRQVRQEKAGGFCPKCGRPAAKSDRFCSRCGADL
jgi:hypothetical protein